MPKPLKQTLRHCDMGRVDSHSNPPFVFENAPPRRLCAVLHIFGEYDSIAFLELAQALAHDDF